VSRKRVSCLLVSAVLVGIPARSDAQAATAALTVTVLDPSNAAVPEARVTVTSADSGLERARDTGPDGVFTVADLPPGPYRLTVMRAGFTPGQVDAELHVGDRVALRVPLTVGTLEGHRQGGSRGAHRAPGDKTCHNLSIA
jgi:hypothetical protein